jgi:YD repeat-containing protein
VLLLGLSALLGGSALVTYNYDAAGRLVSVTYDDGSTVTYGLDAAGNRTTVASTPPTPVTTPGSFAATAQSASQINVTWTASSGGSGVAGYYVYRGGTLLTPTGVTTLSYADSGLSTSSPYTYTAVAYDNDGNTSPATAPAAVTTCALPTIASFGGTTVSSSQINLSWSASDSCGLGLASSPNATYKIYRDGSLIATITQPTTTSYSDTGLFAASSHTYTLYAYDTGGNKNSATANAGTFPLPSIQSFTAATASGSSITLTWSATDSGGPGGLSYSVTNTTLSRAVVPTCTSSPCTDTGLTVGTDYSYQLTAQDSDHDAATASASAWTDPGTPGTPTFSSIGTTSVTVSWAAPTSGTVASYAYSLNGGSWTNVGNVLTKSITGLTSGTYYAVQVRASNATGGTGSASNTGSFYTVPGAPGTPTFTAVTTTSFTVTWAAPSGTVTSYAYSLNGGSWTNVGNVLTKSISGLTSATPYTVQVEAINTGGTSSASSASVETLPLAPTSLTVSPTTSYTGGADFTVYWTKPSGTLNHFALSRQVNSGTPALTDYPASTTSIQDSGVAPPGKTTTLTYEVRACVSSDESACGAWSNSAVETVLPGCPPGGCQ